MPEQISNQVWKLSEYGVAGIVLAVVLLCAIALVFFLLRQFEKNMARLDQANERQHMERAKWFEITTALKTSIDSNNAIILAHNQRADDAAGYVRQEHKDMCAALTAQTRATELLIQKLELKPCLIERA
jgi:uncharacterized membrane protein YhiD involved in acid resistance